MQRLIANGDVTKLKGPADSAWALLEYGSYALLDLLPAPWAPYTTHLSEIAGHQSELIFDSSRPDGTPQKPLNSYRLTTIGWQPRMEPKTGLRSATFSFEKHQ